MRSTDDGAERNALAHVTTRAPQDALEDLRSRSEGLSRDEVVARLAQNGLNELPRAHGPGLVRQLFDQLFHFFALMLWVAGALAFLVRGAMWPPGNELWGIAGLWWIIQPRQTGFPTPGAAPAASRARAMAAA